MSFPQSSFGMHSHADGDDRFVQFAQSRDADAAVLATDITLLIEFIQGEAHPIATEPQLRASATVFLGNSIIRLRPVARWRAMGSSSGIGIGDEDAVSWEVGDDSMSFVMDTVITRLCDGNTADGEMLAEVLLRWADEGKADDAEAAATGPLEAGQPATLSEQGGAYRRPAIAEHGYRDAGGAEYHYGNRWPDGPPEETYSVDSHPERFAPLHTVADALVEYLVREYEVTAEDDPAAASELFSRQQDVIRVTRLTPSRGDAAPLAIAYTAYPGVMVLAGVLVDLTYPTCGCDACDETASGMAESLERDVLAVVAGGFAERYPVGRKRNRVFELVYADASGSSGGTGGVDTVADERRAAAESRLAALPNNWQGWTPRSH